MSDSNMMFSSKNQYVSKNTYVYTLNSICKEATESLLQIIDVDNPPSPSEIEIELVNRIQDWCAMENQLRPKGNKLAVPSKLLPTQIGEIMLALHNIVNIDFLDREEGEDSDGCVLAIYQRIGSKKGVYSCSTTYIESLIQQYNYSITAREINEVLCFLKRNAKVVRRTAEPDLIAVNNGIFNFKTKELMPFSPDYIFTAKLCVDYNPTAVNVVIHNDDDGTDWDIESWMKDLSDDPEIVELLWEVIAATVRPFVRWNKSAWFYSETGNNGKGTLCSLMRNICGDGNHTSIPVADFDKPFHLEPLLHVNVVITDENDVGDYIDKAANYKAAISNDVISINRKHKDIVSARFKGFILQCANDMLRFKDRTDSIFRRLLIIPFDKCFTGKERKYIKNDYLHRKEVLEYVLYKVLHMNFYSFSEPDACKMILEEYKEFSDPVRQFFNEISDELVWDFVPFQFLYELYKSWFRKNSPNGTIQGKNTFKNSLMNVVKDDVNWVCQNQKTRPGQKMSKPEPLIVEYELTDWKNPQYTGGSVDKACRPTLKPYYEGGLIRAGACTDDID